MTDHRTELRRELLAAAHRMHREVDNDGARRSSRRMGILIGACSVVALAVVGAVIARDTEPASANVFDFSIKDQDLVIEIVGTVDDLEAAKADLGAEGVQARLVPVPAAPSLEGQVVSAFADFGQIEVETDGGRTTTITIPVDAPGTLTIRYGRPAEPNEDYEATESAPDCGTYAGRTVTQSLRRQIGEIYGPNLRWQELSDGIPSNVDGNTLSPDAAIVDMLPTGPQSVLVVVTDGVSLPPDGMSCRA